MADRRNVDRGKDRRKAQRVEVENELTLTVISAGNNPPAEKIMYNLSKDISDTGARIQSNVFLPVDSLINIKYQSKNQNQFMTAIGKVKWIKSLFADELFEAGLEFVYEPSEAF